VTCPPGQYCNGGVVEPIDCQKGYYCSIGSDEIAPVTEEKGGICPIDHYCPEGTSQPLMCRDGFNNTLYEGLSECEVCPAGIICKAGGIQEPCPAHHYCDDED